MIVHHILGADIKTLRSKESLRCRWCDETPAADGPNPYGMDVRRGDLVDLYLQDLPEPHKGKLHNACIPTLITSERES